MATIIAVTIKLVNQINRPRIASLLLDRIFSKEKTAFLHIQNLERLDCPASMLIKHFACEREDQAALLSLLSSLLDQFYSLQNHRRALFGRDPLSPLDAS
jgi:hypothetical protein